jgi:hypothetical protein
MNNFLPENYRFSHQYVFFLHDFLVRIIKKGEPKGNFNISFEFRDKKLIKKIEGLSGEDLLNTLIANGYEDECDLLILKQIFIAVLSDFLHFIYTALKASESAKLSVAYALLRKPLKDNLFILEWMLADTEDFLNNYKSEKSFKDLTIDKIPSNRKIEIIEKANSKIILPIIPPDFIYELRYDKSKEYSFEPIWQKANHLITSCMHYKTEEMNLNFVFSDDYAKENQWNTLYFLLPSLLFYAVQIFMVTYSNLVPEEDIDVDFLNRAAIGFVLASKQTSGQNDVYENAVQDLPIKCMKCGTEFKITEKIEKQIMNKWIYRCPKRHRNDFFAL